MADLLAEFLYYERFIENIRTQSKLHVIFTSAARIRQTLVRTKRAEDFALSRYR